MIIPVLTQHYAMLPVEPALYRRHARQEAGRPGRTEEGDRHRGTQRVGAEAVVIGSVSGCGQNRSVSRQFGAGS